MSDTEEALQHIIQLVILCIPLFTLPLILKSSASIMGRVGGMAENISRQAGKRSGSASRKVPLLRRVPEGFDDWKQGREERYKHGVASRRAKRATGRIGSYVAGGVTESGRNRAAASGINQLAEIKKADIAAQKVLYGSQFDVNDTQGRVKELERAIQSGDQIKIKAMIDIMAGGGKGEVAAMGDAIRGIVGVEGMGGKALSQETKKAIESARKENWGDIKAADPGFAAASLDPVPFGPQPKLDITAPQFKSMSAGKIAEYGQHASDDTLQQVRENTQIWSEMDDGQKAAWSDLAQKRGLLNQPTSQTQQSSGQVVSTSDLPRGATAGRTWEESSGGVIIPRDRE